MLRIINHIAKNNFLYGEFFKEKLEKYQVEETTNQVQFIQGIGKICEETLSKVKLSLQISSFGKKNLYHSIIKHSILLETLIHTLKREKMKQKILQNPETKDFNEINKRHNAEKKYEKKF